MYRLRLVVVTTLILFCVTSNFAQNQNLTVFSAVPAEQRARLAERLTLLVEYQKTQQWDKQYDLLRSFTKKAEGKADFINRTQQAYSKWGRLPLLDFTPYRAANVQADANTKFLAITGCSELLDKGQKVRKFAVVEAYREKNDWFFSELQNYGDGDAKDLCFTKSRIPQRIGLVNDFAEVINNDTRAGIERMQKELMDKVKVEFVVVTVKNTGEDSPATYAISLANLWRVGAESPDSACAILFVTVEDKKWRILPNQKFQQLMSGEEGTKLGSKMNLPFSEGRFGDGIKISVEAFLKKLTEPAAGEIVTD